MANRERKNGLYIMLTDEEKELFDKKLKESGLKNMRQLITKSVLSRDIYVVDTTPLYDMNTLLSRISSNINQIAKIANTNGVTYKKDIDEIKEMQHTFAKEIFEIMKLLGRG